MSGLSISTPALLFSAISLIMLAHTNRFLAYAAVVRGLHKDFLENQNNAIIAEQINNLRQRLYLTRAMQVLGISSLLLCVLCMFLIYLNIMLIPEIVFGLALLLLICSLSISIKEILISVKAIDIHLHSMEDKE